MLLCRNLTISDKRTTLPSMRKQTGKIVRERFTDVFVNQDGAWLAIAAQESAICKVILRALSL